mgnify:CR=1 FL=1
MRARLVVAVLMFLLLAGLVQPVLANDLGRILGGIALGGGLRQPDLEIAGNDLDDLPIGNRGT